MDLNRNYDYKFGIDEEGSVSDPCDEIYRGAAPFSEKETQAVKYLVEASGVITSAMNFHAWGNLWITPFCYSKDPNYETLMDPAVYKFYREFEERIKLRGFTKAGNAMETIQYVANGEASDWMLGVHGIISFSVELGDDSKEDDEFYPSKEGIVRVLTKESVVIDEFFKSNFPIIANTSFGFSATNTTNSTDTHADKHLSQTATSPFLISFANKGIADIKTAYFVLNYFSDDFRFKIDRIEVRTGTKVVKVQWVVNKVSKEVFTESPLTIPKLQTTTVSLVMKDDSHFDFGFRVFVNAKQLFRISNIEENSFKDFVNQLRSVVQSTAVVGLVLIVVLVGVYLFLKKVWSRRSYRQKKGVIEMIDVPQSDFL